MAASAPSSASITRRATQPLASDAGRRFRTTRARAVRSRGGAGSAGGQRYDSSGAAPSDWPVCSASLRGRGAWKHTRQHPLGAGLVTLGHLLVAAIAMWCVAHFHRIARVADLFGS